MSAIQARFSLGLILAFPTRNDVKLANAPYHTMITLFVMCPRMSLFSILFSAFVFFILIIHANRLKIFHQKNYNLKFTSKRPTMHMRRIE